MHHCPGAVTCTALPIRREAVCPHQPNSRSHCAPISFSNLSTHCKAPKWYECRKVHSQRNSYAITAEKQGTARPLAAECSSLVAQATITAVAIMSFGIYSSIERKIEVAHTQEEVESIAHHQSARQRFGRPELSSRSLQG